MAAGGHAGHGVSSSLTKLKIDCLLRNDKSTAITSPQSCQGKEAEAGPGSTHPLYVMYRLSATSRSPRRSSSHPPRTSLVFTQTLVRPHASTQTHTSEPASPPSNPTSSLPPSKASTHPSSSTRSASTSLSASWPSRTITTTTNTPAQERSRARWPCSARSRPSWRPW